MRKIQSDPVDKTVFATPVQPTPDPLPASGQPPRTAPVHGRLKSPATNAFLAQQARGEDQTGG